MGCVGCCCPNGQRTFFLLKFNSTALRGIPEAVSNQKPGALYQAETLNFLKKFNVWFAAKVLKLRPGLRSPIFSKKSDFWGVVSVGLDGRMVALRVRPPD
jgi:hypothetical protein